MVRHPAASSCLATASGLAEPSIIIARPGPGAGASSDLAVQTSFAGGTGRARRGSRALRPTGERVAWRVQDWHDNGLLNVTFALAGRLESRPSGKAVTSSPPGLLAASAAAAAAAATVTHHVTSSSFDNPDPQPGNRFPRPGGSPRDEHDHGRLAFARRSRRRTLVGDLGCFR
jgi:hypothetical protein